MPIINALLVDWPGGWAEVKDEASITAHGRHEALLGLGNVTSEAEMRRVAGEQLRVYADPRTEISTDFAPATTDEWPYIGFGLGDKARVADIDGAQVDEVVKGITVTQDDNGELTFALDVKDVILEEQERFAQALKKMADGTVAGDSAVASPVTYTPPAQATPIGPPVAAVGGGTGYPWVEFTNLAANITVTGGVHTIDWTDVGGLTSGTWEAPMNVAEDGLSLVFPNPVRLAVTIDAWVLSGGAPTEWEMIVQADGTDLVRSYASTPFNFGRALVSASAVVFLQGTVTGGHTLAVFVSAAQPMYGNFTLMGWRAHLEQLRYDT